MAKCKVKEEITENECLRHDALRRSSCSLRGMPTNYSVKMEEVQPDLSNGASKETSSHDLTIPSGECENIVPGKNIPGGIFKYGLTLEELFNLSLDYYKKGINLEAH